ENPKALGGVGEACEATEGKMAKSAAQQVLRRQPRAGGVIGQDCGQERLGQASAQIDGRNTARVDGVGEPPVFHPGDDAVALPVVEPGRRRVVKAVALETQSPRAVGPDILGNAVQQAATIAARGFDQESDTKRSGHKRLVSPTESKSRL